jgi:hypothetical protein
MATRKQNEKRFINWQDLPDGGRRYWFDRVGAESGFQRMIKVVDKDEQTIQLLQEIYNEHGKLIERHQKYPQDTGHEILSDED